jgi:peptidyl-prolyl cis-trans isomerase D
MLTELRKVTRGWIALGVIGLLALAFAIWGINDVFRPISSNDVASGRGIEVTQQEFNLAFENELKNVQAEAQRPVTRQEAVAANFHMQIVDRMVTQRVFDRLAARMGVGTSDATVASEIQNNPAFRNQVTGAFDARTYQSLLAQNQISRSMYENDLRAGMTRAQLAESLVAGLRPPTSFGRMIHAFETESRTLALTAITPNLVPAPPAPTPAEIDAFYKAQAAAFALPEYRAFTMVEATPAAFQDRVQVPEEKIKEMFEFRKARLVTPERRSFVVITGGDQAKATEAARRLAAGEDAATIAPTLGMQALTFSQKTREDAPDPRIGEAVFALQAGQSTGAVQGLTWFAARVSEIIPGVAPSLDEARAQIRDELANDEAQTLMHDAVEKFEDARSAGGDIEAAATQAGLTVRKVPQVDARGLDPAGQPAPAVLDNPALLKTAFEAAEGEPSDWVSTPDGGSFLVRIDALRPSGPPPLEQIRDRVTQAWRAQKIAEGMTALATQISDAVKGGQNFEDAARARRLPTVVTQRLDRRTASQVPSPQLAAAIFGAREGEVVSGAGGPNGGVLFLAQVRKIERADPLADAQGVDQRRRGIASALQSDTLASVQAAARAEGKVKLNQPLIDNLVGKSAPTDGES